MYECMYVCMYVCMCVCVCVCVYVCMYVCSCDGSLKNSNKPKVSALSMHSRNMSVFKACWSPMLSLLQWPLGEQSTLFMSHVTTIRLQWLAIPRVVNKLPALYENWRFSSVFTNDLQVPILNETNLFHICSSYSFWSHFNIIPPMPRSSKWFFSWDFPIKTLNVCLSSPMRVTCLAYLILLDLISWQHM